jgi:hypothetical protein
MAQNLAILTCIGRELYTPAAKSLAREMLMKTREFIGEFCGFVEDFFSEMNGAPAMSAGEAWALTKELMGVIYKNLAMARGVVDGIRENSPGFHIWGALKAHEVM